MQQMFGTNSWLGWRFCLPVPACHKMVYAPAGARNAYTDQRSSQHSAALRLKAIWLPVSCMGVSNLDIVLWPYAEGSFDELSRVY